MNLRQLWHIHVLEKKTLKAVTRVFVKRHFASFLRTEKMMNCQRWERTLWKKTTRTTSARSSNTHCTHCVVAVSQCSWPARAATRKTCRTKRRDGEWGNRHHKWAHAKRQKSSTAWVDRSSSPCSPHHRLLQGLPHITTFNNVEPIIVKRAYCKSACGKEQLWWVHISCVVSMVLGLKKWLLASSGAFPWLLVCGWQECFENFEWGKTCFSQWFLSEFKIQTSLNETIRFMLFAGNNDSFQTWSHSDSHTDRHFNPNLPQLPKRPQRNNSKQRKIRPSS